MLRSRHVGPGVLAVLVLALILFGCIALSLPSASVSTASLARPAEVGGIRAGADLIDLSPLTPGVTVTLTASDASFDVGGRHLHGSSYNGGFLGPTLHLEPGQRLDVVLVNRLATPTNLHFHGLHLSPSGASDNPFLSVGPGETFTYHLDLPRDHPEGTFWYHSHAMPPPTAGPVKPGGVEDQVFAGLSGALIVGHSDRLLPGALKDSRSHTLVFKDLQVDGHDRVVRNHGATTIDSNAPTTRLVNGQLRPVLRLAPGEVQLWRLVNAGADIFYALHLDGGHFTVVAEDGNEVATVQRLDSLVLPPGKRFDVLVQAPAHGSAWLRTLRTDTGPGGDSYPEQRLVKVVVSGAPAPPPTQQLEDLRILPTSSDDLRSVAVAAHRTVELAEREETQSFVINGAGFDMDRSVFAEPARVGTVEEWTLTNVTAEDHPFHLHQGGFQVVADARGPVPYNGWVDTVIVPHKDHGADGRTVIRVRFDRYPGRWMFHCHIAAHEDRGMMSFISVVGPEGVPSPDRTMPMPK